MLLSIARARDRGGEREGGDKGGSKKKKTRPPLFLPSHTRSPLASGVLTGKYSKTGTVPPPGSRLASSKWGTMLAPRLLAPEVLAKADTLTPIAAELNATPAQVAIAWCALNPDVSTVILGATKPAQLADNLGAVGVLGKLRERADLVTKLEEVFQSKPEGVRKFR